MKNETVIMRALYSICSSLRDSNPNANTGGLHASMVELSNVEQELVEQSKQTQEEPEAISYGAFNKIGCILKGVTLTPEIAQAIIIEVSQHVQEAAGKTYEKAICCSNCGKAKTITIKFGTSVSRGKLGVMCDACGCKV